MLVKSSNFSILTSPKKNFQQLVGDSLRFVPMFHVLSWGIPYALLMTGAPVTFTNRFTDPGRSGDGVSQGSQFDGFLHLKNG